MNKMTVACKITLGMGKIYQLKRREDLSSIISDREALFLFDDGNIHVGLCDGQLDNDGDISICRRNLELPPLCLPYKKLIGWEYKDRYTIDGE